MKKHFMTGLAILLPMVLTIFISLFVINLVTKPFEQTVRNALIYYHFPKEGVLTPTQVLLFNKLLAKPEIKRYKSPYTKKLSAVVNNREFCFYNL